MVTSETMAILAAGLLATTFGANEVTHGGLAETMGAGHHHMLDYDGYHCATHDGPRADQHHQHMHGGDWNGSNASYGPRYHEHTACYDEGHPMHDEHAGPHGGPHGGGGMGDR